MAAGEVLRQLEPAVAVGGVHHREVATHAVDRDDAVHHRPFDLRPGSEFQAEGGKEGDGGVEVVDDDGHVVHPLDRHARA